MIRVPARGARPRVPHGVRDKLHPMSDEQDKLKVSLEPPKLFGRKKKADGPAKAPATKARPSEPASADADASPEQTALPEETEDEVAPVEEAVEETPPADET